jgi:hypothetical protein
MSHYSFSTRNKKLRGGGRERSRRGSETLPRVARESGFVNVPPHLLHKQQEVRERTRRTQNIAKSSKRERE